MNGIWQSLQRRERQVPVDRKLTADESAGFRSQINLSIAHGHKSVERNCPAARRVRDLMRAASRQQHEFTGLHLDGVSVRLPDKCVPLRHEVKDSCVLLLDGKAPRSSHTRADKDMSVGSERPEPIV